MEAAHGQAPTTTDPDAETSVLALLSACRRRGLRAERDHAIDGVVISYSPREVTLRLMANRWYRPTPDQTVRTVAVGRRGAEDAIARQLVTELLGAL
jgi:hypothetical protein